MCETWEKEMSLIVTFSMVCINSFILQTFSPQLDLREIFKCKKIKELTERIIKHSSLYSPYLYTFVQSHTFSQNTHTHTHTPIIRRVHCLMYANYMQNSTQKMSLSIISCRIQTVFRSNNGLILNRNIIILNNTLICKGLKYHLRIL